MPPVQGIDANILTQGNAMASQNPIEMIGRLAATQNLMNQNALFQRNFKAQQAIGQISQQAVGPDGKPDWNKFAVLASANADAAPLVPDLLNQLAQNKLIDARALNETLEAKSKAMQMLGNVFLGASNDSKVNNLGDFVKEGYASQMHEIDANIDGSDPKNLIKFLGDPRWAQYQGQDFSTALRNHAYAHMQGGLGLQATANRFGTLGYNDAGDAVFGWTKEYGPGATPFLGPTTPQQAASAGPTAGAAAINAAGGGGAPGTPAPQPKTPHWTPGAPGPQREEAFKYGGELDNAAQYATTFLNNMKTGEQLLNRSMTGRAIPTRLEIGRWAKSAGLDPATVDAIVGGNVDMTQALSKMMLMLGTQSMQQANRGNAAVRSVQEWQKFIDANPNISTDPGAIRKMWHQMKFQARLVQSEQMHYSDWRDSGKDILGFRPAWNQHVNEATNDYLRSVENKDWDQPTAIGE